MYAVAALHSTHLPFERVGRSYTTYPFSEALVLSLLTPSLLEPPLVTQPGRRCEPIQPRVSRFRREGERRERVESLRGVGWAEVKGRRGMTKMKEVRDGMCIVIFVWNAVVNGWLDDQDGGFSRCCGSGVTLWIWSDALQD